jgi:tRNA(Arg) A34 adenosine deaminase TadA
VTEEDTTRLRRAIALAQEARTRGDEPFGAVLLAADGAPLAEAGNRVSTGGDPTAHAEMAAIRDAARAHGTGRLSGATLYSSTEPCAMCAAASYVAGIGRVVFGLREADLPRARGGPPPWLPVQLPAAEVAARGRRRMAGEGPFLEDEAAAPHAGLGGA